MALKKLLPAFNHAVMLLGLLRAPRDAVVVVREFDNLWFLLLSPGFWPFRRRLVLNVNQNFSRPLGRGVRARALGLLTRMGFRLLWLDGGAALPEVRAHFPRAEICVPLFPVQRRRMRGRSARDEHAYTVGIVGYFREDKGGVARALERARELAAIPGVTVAAGFWNDAQRAEFAARAPGIETCSTFEPADYHAFLARCHAVVVLAERDAYYYRHSGIVMDCLSHGTLPVCPDYPVLASVVLRPVPVGAVYDEREDVAEVVRRLVARYPLLRANLALHAAARTPGQVGAALEEMQRRRTPGRIRAAITAK
jgi:hypothetical protein